MSRKWGGILTFGVIGCLLLLFGPEFFNAVWTFPGNFQIFMAFPPLLVIVLLGTANAAEVVLVGEINDTQQLVANNQIYEIGPGELGDHLVTKLIAERVRVVGVLIEKDGIKTIIVKQYKVLAD